MENIVMNVITNVFVYYNEAIEIIFGGIIFLVICFAKFFHTQNKRLKNEIALKDEILSQQELYYTMLLEREENTKKFRHDIRGHISSIHVLLEKKDYEHLEEYIDDMNEILGELQVQTDTGNHIVNAIVADLQKQYDNVSIQWTGLLQDELKIRMVDLCIIFYNLLSNAFQAADKNDMPVVHVNVNVAEPNIVVTIYNITREKVQIENESIVKKVHKKGHGYGLRNVKNCIDTYSGKFKIQCRKQEFMAEVYLPNII